MTDYTDRPEPRPCLAEPGCGDFAHAGTDQCLRHARPVEGADVDEPQPEGLPSRPIDAPPWPEPHHLPARAYDGQPTGAQS